MRPIRNSDPSLYRLISIRTCDARMWMVPSNNIKKLLGGILARYHEIFEIELYAYFFLSNHFHLLVRAPQGNIDEFCENLNREIARRMNWKLRRTGKFWSRRYDDIPLGNEDDLIDAFLYVTTNATRHGLLKDSSQWPGLHSFSHALNEHDREFTFHHFSAEEGAPKNTKHMIRLSILPQLKHLSREDRKVRLENLLTERMKQYQEDRNAEGKGFLGLEVLISLGAGEMPECVSTSKRPFCFSKCLETWKQKRKEHIARLRAYKGASFEYRLGMPNFQFPPFCFKPPLHRRPRLEPFKSLPLHNEIFA